MVINNKVLFDITQTLGLTKPLKEGVVKYHVNGKIVEYKSLYVPGIGWCPITEEVKDEKILDPSDLMLICDKESNFNVVVGKTCDKTLWPCEPWSDTHPCERLDLYINSHTDINKDIIIQYNAIRNEYGCEHLPVIFDSENVYNYFINIESDLIYVPDEIFEYIKINGFDNIRVAFCSFPYLVFPSEEKKMDFMEYDRLQIYLNGYNERNIELHYKGTKPYYFMEEDSWKNQDDHHLLVCNDVAEVKYSHRKKVIYTSEIEEEIEDLVSFFSNKGFDRSAEISKYIAQHKLGLRFRHISGYLEMSDGDDTWEFEGGIAPKYYAEICYRLGLDNEKSNARVEDFESYNDRRNI